MKQQLLLLQDVDSLGKKGEIVTAKPGYVRNYLFPKGFAVVASTNTLRKQEALRAEREKQAVIDRKESEELAMQVEATPIEIRVKVDPEGHMYGSVSAADIAQLLQEKGLPVEKKSVLVTKPIKVTGAHKISLKLKEEITAICSLSIIPEGVNAAGIEAVTAPIVKAEENETETPE
ncbi:MAG: 50S ribosomal protein L9 [Chlamydiae bacterium CG10_big_fil_rev_8_21_14_0_10_42_34]|nr:MAG: 50S ribosomal protein L9 [Chlamydiae bacterium CG10_big_fil_rev_8_21_14_0_10_42_34]